MSVSIQSPLSADVLPSLDYSLSPPPTPVAKRGRHFFPSGAETPVPTFFPSSQSILGPPGTTATVDSLAIERKRLGGLASRPAPRLRLVPRTAGYADEDGPLHRRNADIRECVRAGLAPPPPFTFPEDATDSVGPKAMDIAPPPLYSSSREDSPRPQSKERDPAENGRKLAKLPSFQRGGVHRKTVRRMNSLVARTA